MPDSTEIIGTVISDDETPTFETVRIKLKAGCDVKPGTLVRIPTQRAGGGTLIGRIRSAHECNPNERPEAINVRDTLQIPKNYPLEADSTTIYRIVEVDLMEELVKVEKAVNGKPTQVDELRAPQTLPNSGGDASLANSSEVVKTLGLETDDDKALDIGKTIGGTATRIKLKRESIQRHFFIGGTTGSGKSYAVGVLAEELVRHKLPVVFIDTQDEYSVLVQKLGGQVRVPGEDFTIRISSLTDRELVDLVPSATPLHRDIISAAFLELQDELKAEKRNKFVLADLIGRIGIVGPRLAAKAHEKSATELAIRRTQFLERIDIFGDGMDRANWPTLMVPCLSIKCKHLTSHRLQTIATALLRELQDLRLRNFIPPYAMVIDEAHLFVPEGEGSPCKQIIREGVRIGRHHGICMVLLTQSPVDIDKGVIRQCNTRLVFALEPDQLDAIRGVKADASEEMLRALPKMPQGTCIVSGTYESIKHAIPVKIRERHTNNSEGGKTPPIFDQMAEWLVKKQK
jgi:DNA helicase HerA-like ATPase